MTNSYRNTLLNILSLAIAAHFSPPASSQESRSISFQDGDKICFIGNSITNNGQFHNFIDLYYATRYPERKVTFFNCGISGNTTKDVLGRLDKDVLVHKPDWAVIMLGMNDVNRSLYSAARSRDAGIDSLKALALNNYRERMEEIIKILLNHHARVILQKPTIYDQTGALGSTNYFGVNDALQKCCRYIDDLAVSYHLPVVDYRTILGSVNRAIQSRDSTSTIIGPDRVHPMAPGHFIMAYEFLRSTIKPGVVSKMIVHARKQTSHCDHCEVRNYGRESDRLFFSGREASLPYPVRMEARPALQYVPFISGYDRQLLQADQLEKGDYDLRIDSIFIGRFSRSALKKGINLAAISTTPQYLQSLEILSLLTSYRECEGHIRSLKFVEFNFLAGADKNNVDSVRGVLDRLLQSTYGDSEYKSYYKEQFDHYLEFKPREAALQKTMDGLLATVYERNRPRFHFFELIKIK